jgi:ABC-type transporter Mla MlaB component
MRQGKEGPALAERDNPPCLAISPLMAPADALALCERARDILEREPATVLVCDVGAVGRADLGIVEALARVRLMARRLGCAVQLRRASMDLVDLLALIGLRRELPLEVERQAEQRKEAGRVEEERDPGDPAA